MDNGLATAASVFLCLAVVAAVVGAIVLAMVRRRSSGPAGSGTKGSGLKGSGPADPFRDTDADALRGDPRALKPGDIVEIRGATHAVRGSLRFAEGAWSWQEHLLDDAAGHKTWLSVEEDPDLKLALWTEVPSATVRPGRPTVDFDGRRYHREESGRAAFTGVGATGLDTAGAVEYHDYAAPDGPLLSFERYGNSDRWEVGRGERLHRAELIIYPQAG